MYQKYLHNILADQRTRLMVVVLSLAMLAYQSSIVFWQLYPAPSLDGNVLEGLVAEDNTVTVPQQSNLEKARLIGRANLFGKLRVKAAPVKVVEEAPKTKLNYKLRGIYYSDIKRLSSAIVETRANESKFYRLEDELAENIILAAIEPNHILINRYGKIERLNLEKSEGVGPAAFVDTRPTDPKAVKKTNLLRSYKKRYVANPMALANRFRAVPVAENGQNVGFKLKALRGESLLKKLDFKSNDVFTKINGISLDKPFEALDALKSLTTASDVSITILRDGNERTINFKL